MRPHSRPLLDIWSVKADLVAEAKSTLELLVGRSTGQTYESLVRQNIA